MGACAPAKVQPAELTPDVSVVVVEFFTQRRGGVKRIHMLFTKLQQAAANNGSPPRRRESRCAFARKKEKRGSHEEASTMMRKAVLVFAGAMLLATAFVPAVFAQDDSHIRHVLLISIDGMHAAHYLNWSKGPTGVNSGKPFCPQLAELGENGGNSTPTPTSHPPYPFHLLLALAPS